MKLELTLRAATPGDEPFLCQVYATTRSSELAMVAWTEMEKAAFVEMQFRAKAQCYREHYPNTSFDVIVLDGLEVGRLYVARWSDAIRTSTSRCCPTTATAASGRGSCASCNPKLLPPASPSFALRATAGRLLRIHVERFNPAMRLYERLGFTQIEDKGVYLFLEWLAAP